jgi:hypothetical protein
MASVISYESQEVEVEIDDSQSNDTYESESDMSDFEDFEVLEAYEQVQAAANDLARARQRYNLLAGIDDDNDSVMPDAPPPPPVVSESIDMDGIEHPAPDPIVHYFDGFLQVLGADGFYHQTRYIFTATTTQATQLFGRFSP